MIQFIDLAAQQERIRDRIQSRMNAVMYHGQYIMGPEVHELEVQLGSYVGSKHCITCSSGTDALLMVLMAYGVPWLVLLIIFIFMVMILIDYTDPVNKEQRIKDDKETLKKIKKELKADNRNKK